MDEPRQLHANDEPYGIHGHDGPNDGHDGAYDESDGHDEPNDGMGGGYGSNPMNQMMDPKQYEQWFTQWTDMMKNMTPQANQ